MESKKGFPPSNAVLWLCGANAKHPNWHTNMTFLSSTVNVLYFGAKPMKHVKKKNKTKE